MFCEVLTTPVKLTHISTGEERRARGLLPPELSLA